MDLVNLILSGRSLLCDRNCRLHTFTPSTVSLWPDRSRYQYYFTDILNEITEEIMTELLKGDRI